MVSPFPHRSLASRVVASACLMLLLAAGLAPGVAAQSVLSVNPKPDLSSAFDAVDAPDTRAFVRLATQNTNVLVEGGNAEARLVVLFVQGSTVVGSRVSDPVSAQFGRYYEMADLVPDGFTAQVEAGLQNATQHPDTPAPLASMATVPVSNFYDAVQFLGSRGAPASVPARLFAGQRLSGSRIGVLMAVVPDGKAARAQADVLPAAFVVEASPPPVADAPDAETSGAEPSGGEPSGAEASLTDSETPSSGAANVPADAPMAAVLDVNYDGFDGAVPDGTTLSDLGRVLGRHGEVVAEGGSVEAQLVALGVESGGRVVGSAVSDPLALTAGLRAPSDFVSPRFASQLATELANALDAAPDDVQVNGVEVASVSDFYPATDFLAGSRLPDAVNPRFFAGQRLSSGARVGLVLAAVPTGKAAQASVRVNPTALVLNVTKTVSVADAAPSNADAPSDRAASDKASDDATSDDATSAGAAANEAGDPSAVVSEPSGPTASILDVRYDDYDGSVGDGTTLSDLGRVLGRHGEVIAEGGSVEAQLVALGVESGGRVVGSAVSDPLALTAGLRAPSDFVSPRFASQLATELANALDATPENVQVRGAQVVSVSDFYPATDFLAGSRLPDAVNPRFFAGQRLSSGARVGLVLAAVPTGKAAQASVRVNPAAFVLEVSTAAMAARAADENDAPAAPTGPARLDLTVVENASLSGSVASSSSDVVTQLRRSCELLVEGGTRDVQVVALGVESGGSVVSSAVSDPVAIGNGLRGLSDVLPRGFASMVANAIADAASVDANVPQRIGVMAVQDTYTGDAFLAGSRIPDAVDARIFAGQQLSSTQRTGLLLAVVPADAADRERADVRPIAFVLEAQPF